METTSKSMSFVYEFNLIKDFPHFERLSDDMQAYIERQIAMVVYESFVIPGDEDYLTARLLAQKGLLRAFYWAAAQAIEKYLKAFLLFNGGHAVDHTKYKGHPIRKLFDDAANKNKIINKVSTEPHADINLKQDHCNLLKSIALDKFIEDIEAHGSADNRYNSSGVKYSTLHLFALDNVAYAIRGQIGVPSIEYSLKHVHDDLLSAFVDNNPLFCSCPAKNHSELPSKNFPIINSLSVTRLDYLIKNKNDNWNTEVLRWLKKKMTLPHRVSKKI